MAFCVASAFAYAHGTEGPPRLFGSGQVWFVLLLFAIDRFANACTTVGAVVAELLFRLGSVAVPVGVAVAVAVRLVPSTPDAATVPPTSANATWHPPTCSPT